MTDKTPRGGPSGDGPSDTSPRSGWLTKPRSPQRELPDLVEGDLSQELPRALREATRKLFPLRSNDPLDTGHGRSRVTTTESLSGKKPQEYLCSECSRPAEVLLFDQNHTNGKCPSCVGEKALIRPVTQAKCEACGQNLP